MPTGYAFQKTRNYPSDLISLIGDVPAGLCTPQPGFTMIVSDERSWCSDLRDEENRVTTDIHLHCEKWDQLLNEGDWEPEIICAELPEFLQFVRQVQDFISCNSNKTADQE
ncbi:hypothetical protein pdam_00004944 [Pocillopora damicornis]|uniref:Uncharacterized protein n=1 Tax=Pocillopora damicornis TaxID=46731 RepID=A0A3M6UVS5_POCDA|nr:hypothetical protein pdam_00004944 [Pocillopora damicornis]